MAKNPYTVLGVDPNASDDEIKKAYHNLCRKYHPDRYTDPGLAEAANDRMQEINAAYDEIQKLREQGGDPYSGFSGSDDTSYRPGGQSAHREAYNAVRDYINGGRIAEALSVLDAIPMNDRGAEWAFLYGCVLVKCGRFMEAGGYFDRACRMDPDNREYASARDELRNHTYGSGGTNANSGNTVDCNTGCGDGCCSSLWNLCCCLRCFCCGC